MSDTPTEEPTEAVPTDEAPAAAAPAEDATPPAEPDPLREGVLERLAAELGDGLLESHLSPGDDLWVRVALSSWREAAAVAKHDLGCLYFDFLSAIDWLPSPFGRDMDSQEDLVAAGADPTAAGAKDPGAIEWGVAGGTSRFQLLARVESHTEGFGITFKADLDDEVPAADTWIPVYAGANWHERETFEMYGVDFVGHPNLRKLYLPGDFEGHPLRKDFPLLARRVKPWPGIVDVEPMPGDDSRAEDTPAEEASS